MKRAIRGYDPKQVKELARTLLDEHRAKRGELEKRIEALKRKKQNLVENKKD